MNIARIPDLSEHTYRCQVCNALCVRKKVPHWSRGVTKTGDYGSNTTPEPTTFWDQIYSSSTISFTAASGSDPAQLSDSAKKFADNHLRPNMTIKIETTSGTNDGTYTIEEKGVTNSTILLISSDSLTTEDAATAGTVTLYVRTYKSNVTTGCPFCGSLNSRR